MRVSHRITRCRRAKSRKSSVAKGGGLLLMMDNLISELRNLILRGLNERLSILDGAVTRQIDTSPSIVSRKGTSGVGRKDLQCGVGLGGS